MYILYKLQFKNLFQEHLLPLNIYRLYMAVYNIYRLAVVRAKLPLNYV